MSRVVNLTFHLAEDVTPEIFAERVARACAREHALRLGESVNVGLVRYVVEDVRVPDDDPYLPGHTVRVAVAR